MSRMFVIALVVASSALVATRTASASTISFTDQTTFLTAAGSTTTFDFEGFAAGTAITNQLAGILSVTTDGSNGSTQAEVGSIAGLPFPMTAGQPTSSGDRFLSSELAAPIFATAGLAFQLAASHNAAGFFVVDGAPLGGFSLELFDGATLVGSHLFGAQTLPNSFIGLTSTAGFNRVVIDAANNGDSWGIDDLTIGGAAPVAVPEPASLTLLGCGLAGLVTYRLRRRKNA